MFCPPHPRFLSHALRTVFHFTVSESFHSVWWHCCATTMDTKRWNNTRIQLKLKSRLGNKKPRGKTWKSWHSLSPQSNSTHLILGRFFVRYLRYSRSDREMLITLSGHLVQWSSYRNRFFSYSSAAPPRYLTDRDFSLSLLDWKIWRISMDFPRARLFFVCGTCATSYFVYSAYLEAKSGLRVGCIWIRSDMSTGIRMKLY